MSPKKRNLRALLVLLIVILAIAIIYLTKSPLLQKTSTKLPEQSINYSNTSMGTLLEQPISSPNVSTPIIQGDSILMNGINCKIITKVTNSFDSTEEILITQPCVANYENYSVFSLKDNQLTYLNQQDPKTFFGGDGPLSKNIKFLNKDEFLLEMPSGEGAGCSSGGIFFVNKFNLRTGITTIVADVKDHMNCHDMTMDETNNDNACWDRTDTYTFQKTRTIKLSTTCTKSTLPSEIVFKVDLDNANVLTKTTNVSLGSESVFSFSALENTFNLLTGSTVVQFTLEGKMYSLDIQSSKIQ